MQRDRKGEENPGLYLMPADGGAPLADPAPAEGADVLRLRHADGKWLYFHANDQKPDSYAIYRWSTTHEGEGDDLRGAGPVGDRRPPRRTGGCCCRSRPGALSSEYSEWDPATKKLTPVIGQGEAVEYQVALRRRHGQVLVLTPKLGEFRRLYRSRGGKLAPVTPEMKWDVSGFDVDEARTRVLYTVNEGGYTRLAALDAKTLAPVALPKLPEGADHVYAGATTPERPLHDDRRRDGEGPAHELRLRLEDGDADAVGGAERARGRHVHVRGGDARDLPRARRHADPGRSSAGPRAASPQPCPVVVEFHGGPEGQAQPGFSTYAQIFVDAGLRLRRAERARQRRLRQDLARRRQRPQAPRDPDRHRGRRRRGRGRPSPRTARRRRSASWAAATAATRRSSR